MPGGLPLGLELANATELGSVGGTTVTTMTSGAANTKGAYTQLTASSPVDTCWIAVQLIWSSVSGSSPGSFVVDIGVGASGSEVVVASNLMLNNAADTTWMWFYFPIQIPAGSRIAARGQSTVASAIAAISVILFDGSFTQMEGAAGVDSIGFNAGASSGTLIVPPSSGTSKGSYSQLIASTTRDYMGLMLAADIAGLAFPAAFTANFLDIAIGASGSEQVILPNIAMSLDGPDLAVPQLMGQTFVPVAIPAGSRIAARASNIYGTATDFNLTAYGVWE